MTLLRTAAVGSPARIWSSSARKVSVLPNRRIRRRTGAEACWKLMSKYGATPGVLVSTSTRPGRISAGCR